MDPQEYKDMVTFISSNHTKFPESFSQVANDSKSKKNKRSFYRNKVKKFLVRDNTLYRKLNPKSLLGVKVVLKDQVDDILKRYHCNEDGTHNGINRTLEALKRKYWWLGVTEDVRQYAKVCEICKAGPNYVGMKKGKKEVQVHDDSWKVVKTEDDSEPMDLNAEQFNSFRFSKRPTLEQIRTMQEKFCNERNWNQFHTPRNLLMALVGEVGELAEIFQWRGEVAQGLPEFTAEEKDHVGQELSDVLVYLIRLADKCEIDLPAAVLAKIEQNRKKYPVEHAYGKNLKYTAYQTQDEDEEQQQYPQQQQQQQAISILPKILNVTGSYSQQQATVTSPKIMKVSAHKSQKRQRQQQQQQQTAVSPPKIIKITAHNGQQQKATVSSPTILKVTAQQSQQLLQLQQQQQQQRQLQRT